MEEKKILTPSEICKIAGISKNTLFDWEKKELIPKAKRDWRGWRVFSEKDLQKVLEIKNTKKLQNLGEQ